MINTLVQNIQDYQFLFFHIKHLQFKKSVLPRAVGYFISEFFSSLQLTRAKIALYQCFALFLITETLMFTNELLIQQYNLAITKKDLNSFPEQKKKITSLPSFIKVILLCHNGHIVQAKLNALSKQKKKFHFIFAFVRNKHEEYGQSSSFNLWF